MFRQARCAILPFGYLWIAADMRKRKLAMAGPAAKLAIQVVAEFNSETVQQVCVVFTHFINYFTDVWSLFLIYL